MKTEERMNVQKRPTVDMAVEAVDLLLQVDSGDVALLYLHFLRYGNFQPTHWNPTRCQLAQGQLVALGLLGEPFFTQTPLVTTQVSQTAPMVEQRPSFVTIETTAVPTPPVEKVESALPPVYTSADMVIALEKTEFRLLLENVNKTRGKASTSQDEKYLYEIHDHLQLPVDVILMVVSFCVQKQKFSQTARNYDSMKNIRHEAYSWEKQGILTIEEAMAYADTLEKLGEQEQEVIKIFHLYKTHFTQKMYNNMKEWNDWGFAMDTYPLAYEACQKGLEKNESPDQFSWGYTHGIFSNWHKAGVHTRTEILAYQEQNKGGNGQKQNSGGYYPSKNKSSRGTYAHDTLIASATTPPPPEYAKKMQEDYDLMEEILKKYGGS